MKKEQFVGQYSVLREQTNSLKWDSLEERFGAADLLPAWVADMDFSVPETVKEALIERIQHGVFGYTRVAENYFKAYQGWQERHEKSAFKEDWLFFSTGVVQSLYDLIDCFTDAGDGIIIQPPVYYPFFHGINDKHRQLIVSNLKQVEGRYVMDLDDFEAKLMTEKPKLFILCSPHNPVGRLWTHDELREVLQICAKHQVLVIADEIHSDIVLAQRPFVSAISVDEGRFLDQLIVVNSPSKTFNFASLLNSHLFIPNETLRMRYEAWKKEYKQTENSLLGQLAAKVAYETGDEWMSGLLDTLRSNFSFVKEQLAQSLPQANVTDLEGTYLAWIDLRSYVAPEDIKTVVQDKAKLAIDFGEWFSEDTKGFIRLNLATTPERIEQAISQLVQAVLSE